MTNINLKIILAIIIAFIGAGVYFASTGLVRLPAPDPAPVACTQEAKQCPDGSYVGRTGPNCEFSLCPEIKPLPNPVPAPVSNTEKIIRKVGEQESSFLIQKINSDSVDGLWNQAYPVARPEGTPRTLNIGDDIGYACEGISEKLTSIDYSGQTVTFTKITGKQPYGGCPICLAGNTQIDTPLGSVAVKDLKIGMPIWTTDKTGNRVFGTVAKTSKVPVSSAHQMVHLILNDGRDLFVSPGHPTTDGRSIGDLKLGDRYDGASITGAQRIPYDESATYDVLPSGETGFYWANGILIGSTLNALSS